MKNELVINGKQNFMGIEIPVIEGGFGEGQKVILAKTIAEIHNAELRKINELINQHIDEFEVGIDLLNLKNDNNFAILSKDYGFYSQNALNSSKYIYLLSEQGYMLLVGFMKTEKAKEIRKKLRREYFKMRQELNSPENLKNKLLLQLFSKDELTVANAHKQLVELETAPLKKTIEEKEKTIEDKNEDIDALSEELALGSTGTYDGLSTAELFKMIVSTITKNSDMERQEVYNAIYTATGVYKLKSVKNRVGTILNAVPEKKLRECCKRAVKIANRKGVVISADLLKASEL